MHDRAPASLYLALADESPDSDRLQLSRPRKAFLALCAVLILAATPLFWSNAAQAGDNAPHAVASSSGPGKDGHGDDDHDNSGPGSGDDDDDDTDTRDTDADTRDTDATDDTGTRGQTRTGRDHMTGRETGGQNTDRGGLDTGVSTRGETDRGDDTGKTERR